MATSSLGARLRAEPLVWFALVGMGLFGLDRLRSRPVDEAHRIVIDDAFVEGLRTDATRRTGHAPDATETRALIDAWVREEALYREARALELDVGDTIVRRRLVQKIELVLAAETPLEAPTDDALAAYLQAHALRWTAPDRTSVTLCFYARELHEDAQALALAHVTNPSTPCDPHLTGETFRERTDAQIAALIGAPAASSLRGAEIGSWQGPFETSRGLYDVRIDARAPGGPRALADVRDEVQRAMEDEQRTAAVSRREQAIAARYEVVRL
jgi:hypothetical protein